MTIDSVAPAATSNPAPDAGPMGADARGIGVRLLRRLVQQWNQFGDFAVLALPGRQPLLVELRRAALIASRARMVATLAAALTLAWIAVDLLVLPAATAFVVAIARVLAAAAFAWVAVSFARRDTIWGAYASLALLYAIATCFYVFALGEIMASKAAAAQARPLIALYGFIPVMAVMGLSLFPLTFLEMLAPAGIILFGQALARGLGLWHAEPGNWIAGYWEILLAATIAALACADQLGSFRALMRHAMRDTMIWCYSRSSMETFLELQFANAERSRAPMAVAFLELDDLKSLNETFGSDAGDGMLVSFAERLHSTSRRGDMVGRWQGGQFMVLFPNASVDQGATACERMRAAGFGMRPDGRPVSASIGLAEKNRDGAATWQALVELAEARTRQARRRGKNCVVAW